MGEVLTNVTGINTTITVVYEEGSETDPGTFLFGIAFDKDFDPLELSFSKSLSLGDLASVSVEESSFSIDGGFSVYAEFGIVFAPDDTTVLKLLGSLKNESESCADFDQLQIPFFIIYKNGTDALYNNSMTITPDCSTKDTLLQSLDTAFRINSAVEQYVTNVTKVGTSSFSVAFNGEIK